MSTDQEREWAHKQLAERERRVARSAQLRPRLKKPIRWMERVLSSLRWSELMGKAPSAPLDPAEQRFVDDFHRLFYALNDRTFGTTHWLGARAVKCPFDLWVMQEIVFDTRPDLVIETGVFEGGTTLFFATLLDLLGEGEVIGIDVDLSRVHERVRAHPRVVLIEGSSTDGVVTERVRKVASSRRVMVDLDSDHSADHVLAELRAYADLVSEGCYVVVEDTNVGGRPILREHGPGPTEAIEAWLASNPPFVRDRSREKYLLTFNPGGFLRRVSKGPSDTKEGLT